MSPLCPPSAKPSIQEAIALDETHPTEGGRGTSGSVQLYSYRARDSSRARQACAARRWAGMYSKVTTGIACVSPVSAASSLPSTSSLQNDGRPKRAARASSVVTRTDVRPSQVTPAKRGACRTTSTQEAERLLTVGVRSETSSVASPSASPPPASTSVTALSFRYIHCRKPRHAG